MIRTNVLYLHYNMMSLDLPRVLCIDQERFDSKKRRVQPLLIPPLRWHISIKPTQPDPSMSRTGS